MEYQATILQNEISSNEDSLKPAADLEGSEAGRNKYFEISTKYTTE